MYSWTDSYINANWHINSRTITHGTKVNTNIKIYRYQNTTGPNSNLGYRSVWHHLQMKGTRVPRKIVANLLPSFSISSSIHIVIDYCCARYLHGGFRSLVWEVKLAWQIWQLYFEKESFAVRKFCREKECFAVRKKVLPWERVFCREKECFAVRKKVLPWERKFCRDTCGPP